MRCLRSLLHIRWQDKIPNTEKLQQADMTSVHILLEKAQVRWAGHVCRMPDHRIPKQLLCGELCLGKRAVGGQKKRFKNTLKASLKNLDIQVDSWEELAQDRSIWRSLIHTGAQTAEERKTHIAEQKRTLRKTRAASTT
ncbi:uncharacterized protein [Littorina saxatilis]|uniref:Uncharacterized protein n=1 Tax=Littorina saxatilis TaxID=31220 RepID=A0AAN9C820_9CAEN